MLKQSKNNFSGTAQDHIEFIDVIRGIAALSVALLHIREINWIGMQKYWSTHGVDGSFFSWLAYVLFPIVWGSIGVPIFFVISGYVIHRGSRYKIVDRSDVRFFFVRRLVIIYPAFIAAIVITFSLDTFSEMHGGHEKLGDLSFGNAIVNLFASAGVLGSSYGSNGALWSLALEIQFYIIYPIALIVWRSIGPQNMLGLTFVVSLVGYFLLGRHGVIFFAEFYFSCWLGAYVADMRDEYDWGYKTFWCGVFFMIFGCGIFFLKLTTLTHMIWSIGFAMIFGFLLKNKPLKSGSKLKEVSLNMLKNLGDFSYSLYAVHLPVAVAFNVYFLNGQKNQNIIWVVPCLFVSIVVARINYSLVEKPSIDFLKRLAKKE